MKRKLSSQLGSFLLKRRGDRSYAEFAKLAGISSKTLIRLEQGKVNITMHKLETMVVRLNVRLKDVFPG